MATIAPPPNKRQKVAISEKAQAKEEASLIPAGLGNVTVQFVDTTNGQSTGAPIAIPVSDSTVKNLEQLLNTLQRNVGGPCVKCCAHRILHERVLADAV